MNLNRYPIWGFGSLLEYSILGSPLLELPSQALGCSHYQGLGKACAIVGDDVETVENEMQMGCIGIHSRFS